jgi:hypothetical protein
MPIARLVAIFIVVKYTEVSSEGGDYIKQEQQSVL